AEARKSELVGQAVALARQKLPTAKAALAERFIELFYAHVSPDDVLGRGVDELYGAAISLWQFGMSRPPGRPKLRADNPRIEDQGWASRHSVIEIVNDDMPFLVDSVTMEVNRHRRTLHLIIHPILAVRREADGTLAGLADERTANARRESFIHVEIDRISDRAELASLATGIERVLDDVRAAVDDWKPMRERLQAVLAEIERRAPPLPAEELSEGKDFLHWLGDNHFTFLGYRCNELIVVDGEDALKVVPGSSLGILREAPGQGISASFSALPPEVRAYARRPELLIVTKATARSTVHRPGYLDYVAVKRFDPSGQVVGEHRFLGLFTSTAYSANPADIPLLRRKLADVVARAGLPPGGHASKALVNILETYPRDELFQTSEENLLRTAKAILHLEERQRLRLFVRRDAFERFLSCLIYAPRENYTTELRRKWQAILLRAFGGSGSEFNVHLSESALARVMITVRTTPGHIPPYDVHAIEAELVAAARRWEDDLRDALIEGLGEARGNERLRQFGAAFPASYREDFAARTAVPDIEMMAALTDSEPLGMSLYRPLEALPGTMRFKLFHRGAPVTLSDSLPMLENMGLKVLEERPYRITPEGLPPVWIHDLGLVVPARQADVEVDALHAVFADAFGRVFRGEVESDDLNRLVVAARLPAEEIDVLRAYAKYLRQIGFPLSQAFIESTLAAHADLARSLVELFELRFDPTEREGVGARTAEQLRAIEARLEAVENLSEDRVLRQYLALIQATTRTNFWRRDAAGRRRSFLSIKFDPSKVPGLPEPKPMFEIFVYSTRFEGVHLRGGRVARGGLRWSDRPEDFRTEVLGLVKAQMVKNTVIVPVGSKGGFVLKRAPSPSDREAYLREGVACYQNYLRGLLDLTDNRVGDRIVPPPDVKRHDADDPYLVVAADKGTATFSDYANAISKEYGFWLGDAFASGGSAGYDHKAMGITARGAWESVQRHFREMGVDTQATDFTVAGIGDMSGDVFGNGMLLSRHIKLVAAFDHRHVFLDPDPDPGKSFAERERMFRLPRSSWADYDAALISKGGGIYPRSAKSIAITPEVKRALAIEAAAMTPAELVNAILKAPVDLIYNGGIGTYIKAASETHAQVGDRANDGLRVNGRELRCKVFAEGGNLGCTQLGRVEFALRGGRINTDAIDNSAGVDTSDHEVNIKILLGLPIAEGELTEKQRNALLAEMTDDVAALVLRDNTFQTQALSVTGHIASQMLDAHQRFMQFLEKGGRLNRALEFLPSDEEIAERRAAGRGLTSPERAVLLAYSKIWLYDELLAAILPDDPWVATALERYFPKALRERDAAYMPRHPLKREIIATYVTNSMVNRVGSSFVHRLLEATGAKPPEIVRAYLLNREVFGFVDLWMAIEALDNVVEDAVQSAMLIDTRRLIDRGSTWFLRSRRLNEDMAATIAHFAPQVATLATRLPELLDAGDRVRIDAAVAAYVAKGVPQPLALRVATLDTLYAALDIIEVADGTRRSPGEVAELYCKLSTKLGLPWLREKMAALPADAHWRILAKGAMLDDLASLQRTLTAEVLGAGADGADPARLVAAWEDRNRRGIERAAQLMVELRGAAVVDAAMLSVALRELRNLT
ncbi:MAG TPA: NAD-glutamate dehydrogenase, partial [Casimicrobiaceae bacterium]|nr:NAD-glutamate dehydrogenase [Casimicrobiaceae bacterium]